MTRISEMLKGNFMFQSLSPQQKEQIFKVMRLRNVKAGDTIIREGDQVRFTVRQEILIGSI
jgi:hypothetical protein